MSTSGGIAVVTSGTEAPWKKVDPAPENSQNQAEMIKTLSRI